MSTKYEWIAPKMILILFESLLYNNKIGNYFHILIGLLFKTKR